MSQVAIFLTDRVDKSIDDNGAMLETSTPVIAILYPAPGHSILEAAKHGVPTGIPFLIINQEDVQEDQEAWVDTVDFSNPDGYGE